MIDASEIKSTTPNTNGRNLLCIFNRVINLTHVTEIIFKSEVKKSITIKFVNNTECIQEFENQTYFAKSQSILLHCIRNNLFDIQLSEEAHRKWGGYAENESNSKANG